MTQRPPRPAPVRKPYVAGHFYPGDREILRREIDSLLKCSEGGPRPARGVVVPHAGYMYSGSVAGAVYGTALLPRRLVILGPNHTGLGRPISVMNRGAWETPLGTVAIDETLADLILDATSAADADEAAHRAEHALEVQIPFLQVSLGEFTFAPICVGTGRLSDLESLAAGVATALRSIGDPAGIVISTDMTHYEPADVAHEKDHKAIRKMEALDAEGLHGLVRREAISMCGYAPATAGLLALKQLGATSARLVAYANSGDTSGDYREVVGYAGLIVP